MKSIRILLPTANGDDPSGEVGQIHWSDTDLGSCGYRRACKPPD